MAKKSYSPPAAVQSTDRQFTLTLSQRKIALEYVKRCAETFRLSMPMFRAMMEFRDRAYIRQLNMTARQLETVRRGMLGENTSFQDLTVPVIMPQIESSVAYKAGVFLTSPSVFGVVAAPQYMDAAMQFESTLQKQAMKFSWARNLIRVFRNADKYNFGPAVVDWTRVPTKSLMERELTGANAGKSNIEHGVYQGNEIMAIDPYNCFFDPMVKPGDLHIDGEFFGHNRLMTRIAFKRFVASLDNRYTTSIREAYESQFRGMTGYGASNSVHDYYIPAINRYYSLDSLARSGTVDWGKWSGLDNGGNNDINYHDRYLITTLYCRACPSDFGGSGNLPAVYKLHFVNWQVCIYAELLVNVHDYLPAVVMTPQDDGLGVQTPSKLDNSIPYQDMASAMWNVTVEGMRRKVFDRIVYNQKYIDKKDIDPASSVSRIPVRNAALMNFDMGKAIHQIPYQDTQPTLGIQASQLIAQMGDEAAGQNRVSRGQFQKGNKTTTEFDTTMDNSNARQQLEAVVVENQFMTPVKEIIRANTLQNQASESIYNPEENKVVDVDPEELRKAILEFEMTDGVLATDKLMNPQVMQVFMQTAQAIPALQSEFDTLGMFLYWCKLKGAKWVNDFKRDQQGQQNALAMMRQVAAAQNSTPTDGTQNAANIAQAQQAQAQAQAAGQQQGPAQ